ncbi:hypothetical protein HMPREF1621_00023 [Escherichia coli A25922R]|uniref:Uncharacterized protein n=2 Tax=Enterobacteriaceae TaxID=543 RepID=A0A5V1IQR2_SALER|nr:hypothetical protein [Salmonella enterica subsp. enterica]EAQ6309416.1 hypothetical protein [Salmonella enterica]EBL5217809.1 hypothetical protein [Salmonella enterica subsp. enterica serovar Montevideo]EDB8604344.1 hypothetical protein [Salmonella enterica subsp. enterica serovar Senftenberg]EDR4868424.1 hypothetical protein [Salmonella enterica subsp. enterica serovar Bovismorbificans]EEW1503365.1 hypothetical protein [Escherichia coli]EFN8423771.1 hypothetical protein [Escherichia coli 
MTWSKGVSDNKNSDHKKILDIFSDNAFLSMMNERQGRESRARGSGLNQPFTHNGTRKDTFVSVPKSVSEIQGTTAMYARNKFRV